jgi:hypothetical protein
MITRRECGDFRPPSTGITPRKATDVVPTTRSQREPPGVDERKKSPGIAARAEAVSFRRRKMIQKEPPKPI